MYTDYKISTNSPVASINTTTDTFDSNNAFANIFDGINSFASSNNDKDELGRYLSMETLKWDNAGSDPLVFWKANQLTYPTLARDVFSIQPTEKDAEGEFAIGRRMPYYRKSIGAESFRATMLVKSGEHSGIIPFIK